MPPKALKTTIIFCFLLLQLVSGFRYEVDIAVYTGNAAGVAAAVAAAKEGKKVVLIEPSKWCVSYYLFNQ